MAQIKTYSKSVKSVDMINLRHAWKIDDNHYRVYGRDGIEYIVFVVIENGQVKIIACPCVAGVHGDKCFHAAVVIRRLYREKQIG